MSYQLVQSDNNKVLLYVVIAAIVFFMFVLPKLEECYARDNKIIQEKMASLTAPSNNNILKIDKKKCSRDCCLYSQWPVPHMPKKKASKYVGSNLMCNGGVGGGCVCVTDNDLDYLGQRGENYNYKPCSKKK